MHPADEAVDRYHKEQRRQRASLADAGRELKRSRPLPFHLQDPSVRVVQEAGEPGHMRRETELFHVV